MKPLLTTITALLISIASFSQVSLGGGAGFSDKANFVGQLSLNWNIAHEFGVDGGFSSFMSSSKPAFFHIQAYVPIINNESWKVSPMGGYSYKLLNEQIKETNGGSWIVGLETAKNINNRGVLYFRGSYTQSFAWVVVGIRGFLGRRDYCY